MTLLSLLLTAGSPSNIPGSTVDEIKWFQFISICANTFRKAAYYIPCIPC